MDNQMQSFNDKKEVMRLINLSLLFTAIFFLSNIIFGILWAIVCIGLIKLKKWARYMFIVLSTLSIFLVLINFTSSDTYVESNRISNEMGWNQNYALWVRIVFSIIFLALLNYGIAYISRKDIKEKFK